MGEVLHRAVPVSLTENEVIGECLLRLEQGGLPEEKPAPHSAAGKAAVEASIRLLAHLAKRGQPAAVAAFRVPLVARNGTVVRATHQRRMMAPVTAWQEPARLFHDVYPPDRVLGEIYCDEGVDTSVVPALVAWGIAHGDPLSRDVPAELRDDRLQYLAVKPDNAVGASVVREEFTQIALLHPELFNRCDRPEHARALLGLVLAYVAPNDSSWRSVRTVTGRKKGTPASIEVREALWLSDLRWRAWVPVPGEDGTSSRVVASADALKALLDPSWLRDNGAAHDLLGEFFGFDALEAPAARRRAGAAEPDRAARRGRR